MNDRFIILSAHTPEDLVDKLNDLATQHYFTVVKFYEEVDILGVVKDPLWRAVLDLVTPIVMPVEIDEPELALTA